MFRKILLAAVALSFAGAPLAQAQDFPRRKPAPHHRMEPARPPHHGPSFGRPGADRGHWHAGQRYSGWRGHREIRDYQRYGLRRPGRGQHWIRVGNEYLLITAATGFIAGVLAAH
ncbi:MAG: RcnB family protein [Rhizobiales bacterium]|nr:RcnB family protein [Hyphomicrobiales bacterium]OJY06132.1 MAG: hypothetical protein BGP07_00555 [Rhizobiales bacterium 63-22]